MKSGTVIFLLLTIIFLASISCEIKKEEGPVIPEINVALTDDNITKTSSGLILFNNVPFSGNLQEYYSEGQLKRSTQYYLGKKEGLDIGHYFNGNKAYIRPYKNGDKDGEHQGWYENGQISFHFKFKNGLSTGNHKMWYADGVLYKDLNYENGQALGTQKIWRPDGKFRSNYIIKENGRKYGLVGLKRCANIDTKKEKFNRILESTIQ